MTSPYLWTLIAIQIAMGAFDTFYHHEMTERLAWRPSQRRELQLHSVRNALYALLFLTLGWLEVHGIWAMLVITVLVVEVVVTLMDFVEEDIAGNFRRANGSITLCWRLTTARSLFSCCRS
jgi:tryptophan-rich sensory protein